MFNTVSAHKAYDHGRLFLVSYQAPFKYRVTEESSELQLVSDAYRTKYLYHTTIKINLIAYHPSIEIMILEVREICSEISIKPLRIVVDTLTVEYTFSSILGHTLI
jgi:hypothetical protein